MIHYHGTDGMDLTTLAKVMSGRHAFISYAMPTTLPSVASVCSSFALDNGAFTAWRKGEDYDFEGYADWVRAWPQADFHLIPDVIDGDENQNRKLVESWSLDGVPVWHMHESINYLMDLCTGFHKVAIGSSGEYSSVGTKKWWGRITKAMNHICVDGVPPCKLHGLRMLRIEVFSKLPFHSADSTVAARDAKYDKNWPGYNSPKSKYMRSMVIADRVESFQSVLRWTSRPEQQGLF